MALRDDIPALVDYIKQNQWILDHNYKLFDIYEGNLLPYVEADLARQLSKQSFEQAQHRIAPLNILRQLMDKLSRIYPPTRLVVDGSDSDAELLAWYEQTIKADSVCNQANEYFNLFKTALLEPYVYHGQPALRAIPSDRFLPYSQNRVNPLDPTHIIIVLGKKQIKNLKGDYDLRTVYLAYTADEWIAFDSAEDVRTEIMAAYGNIDGTNPYGVLPFVYINRSKNLLVPKPDSDLFVMAKLPSVIMTDELFISMFSSFSIIYGIDIDDKNLSVAPNSFWSFKSDPASEKQPVLNQIKPQGDIDQLTRMLQNLLTIWAQTRGIKVNFSGGLNGQDMASGVSKLVDEMDTYQDRDKQVTYFVDGETDLWDLLLKDMHPIWIENNMLESTALPQFTPTADFEINFAEQIPTISRGDLVEDLNSEVAAGFTTRKRAIKRLNPRMSDTEIDDLLIEIDDEAGGIPDTADDTGEGNDGSR